MADNKRGKDVHGYFRIQKSGLPTKRTWRQVTTYPYMLI